MHQLFGRVMMIKHSMTLVLLGRLPLSGAKQTKMKHVTNDSLQSVQNAAARLASGVRRCGHISPTLIATIPLVTRATARSIQDCRLRLQVSDRPSTVVPCSWPARLWCPSVPSPIIRFTDVRCTTHPQHLRWSMFCCCRTAGLELFVGCTATMPLTRTI